MKNLFLTCMVLFLVFIFGCQESSITGPTQPLAEDQDAQVNNNELIPDPGNHNIIGLKYQLVDPRGGSTLDLIGQVSYKNTVLPAITDIGKVWVKVRLEMSSQLFYSRGSDHPKWKIEKKTEDNVLISNTGPATKKLLKKYTITNRDDILLYVTYLISFNSVKVVGVFLIKPIGEFEQI